MASVTNAFNLLTGAEQQLAAKKKKKNNKAKAEAIGTQPANAQNNAPVTPAPAAGAPTPAANLVVDVSEACAIFERAAREARSLNDKVKLWKDWTRLANDKSAKSLKYTDADGSQLDFKQAILRCKALEICVEGCVASNVTPEKEATLAQMLASFLPNESGAASALANLVVRLSGALSDDAPDTIGAAQRTLHSMVSMLKAGAGSAADAEAANPVEAWLNRINALDKEIARQQGLLQKLGAANKGAVTRETTNTARALVKLHEQKFDLLQPEHIPVAKAPQGALGGCLRTIEELKAVINNHLKEAEGKAGQGPAVAQAGQSYKREEDLLNAQAAQVASQIRTLEAQLHSLRAQQNDIEEKRRGLSRQRGAWESANGGRSGKGTPSTPVLTPAHYREELALAESLQDLVDPRRSSNASPEHVLAMQTSQVGTPLQYVADGEAFLSLALQALSDVPAKLAFCRQRMAQSAKLAQLGALASDKMLTDTKRSAEDAEKLLQDTLRMAEELAATAGQVGVEVHARYDAMARYNPEKASQVAGHIRNIDALAAQVQQQYTAVITNSAAPAAGAGPATAAPIAAPSPAPAPAFTKQAVPTPAPAPVLVQQQPRSNGNAAAAPAPAVAPSPAPASTSTAPAAPPTKPAAPVIPPRQWAKVEQVPAADLTADSSLPTPAEAFKGPGPSGSADADGFRQASVGKKNRRKA